MVAALKLISHKLCPYVQRAVIALTEKGVEFERIDIDLANKPDWFLKISPLGKAPVLWSVTPRSSNSAVILEYLEEAQPSPCIPPTLVRAEHRGWIEFGSTILNDIAGFYTAKDEATFKPRQPSSKRASHGWRRALPCRHGSTAPGSRWWMRCLARCFAISMCSMTSPISAFLQANRTSRAGAGNWRSDRQCAAR